MVNSAQVPLRIKLGYALPALVLSLLGIAFYVYLPKFYAEVVGVNLAMLGYIILASRIFDALTDPLIGYISDRLEHHRGRRKTMMLWALVPLILCFYFLSVPPSFLSPENGTIWFASFTFAFFLFWTMVTIPYESWGPELSTDYDERTRLFSFRDGALVLGTLFAVLLPEAIRTATSNDRQTFQAIAMLYGLLLFGVVLTCLRIVPEKKLDKSKISKKFFLKNVWEVLQNRHFLVLLAAYTISGFGAALPATLIFFYVQDVLGSKGGGAFLLLYFLIGFMFVPIWSKLGVHWGKRNAWMWAMAVNTGAFIGVLSLGKGDSLTYGILVAISAVGYGGTQIIPSAMQADVIDVDELKYGDRREGQFIGLWAISKKLAAALGAGIAFPILANAGYQVGSANNSPDALQMLSFLYAGVPSLCNMLSLAILSQYSLGKEEVSKVREGIDQRNQELKVAN